MKDVEHAFMFVGTRLDDINMSVIVRAVQYLHHVTRQLAHQTLDVCPFAHYDNVFDCFIISLVRGMNYECYKRPQNSGWVRNSLLATVCYEGINSEDFKPYYELNPFSADEVVCCQMNECDI
eukprot:scaffold2277_cov137-Cylindrotheca_fusiformis.AAC.12